MDFLLFFLLSNVFQIRDAKNGKLSISVSEMCKTKKKRQQENKKAVLKSQLQNEKEVTL